MPLTTDQLTIIGIVIGIVFTLLVGLIFFLLGISVRRPKLIGAGGGSSSIPIPGKDIMASFLTIRNVPTFMGIRTHRDHAEIDSAKLYDPETKEYIGPSLLWREQGRNDLISRIKIESGKNASLYVFGKERYSQEFFIFSSSFFHEDLPPNLTTLSGKERDFAIHLTDNIGRKYKFNITTNNSDQLINIRFKRTITGRLQMIREASRQFIEAFRP